MPRASGAMMLRHQKGSISDRGCSSPPGPRWSGPLAVGQSVQLVETLTLTATGTLEANVTKTGENQYDPVGSNNASAMGVAVQAASMSGSPTPTPQTGAADTVESNLPLALLALLLALVFGTLTWRRRPGQADQD